MATDNQNYEIDIDSVYNEFMKSIDSFRSQINISDENNLKLLNNLDDNIFKGNFKDNNNFKPENSVQESRCHTFYRIIGFPVVSEDKKIYNPGHDIIFDKDRKVKSDQKVSIAKNPLKGFKELSDYRENYFKKYLKYFSEPTSVDAGVAALSLINIRDFNSSFSKDQSSIESPFKYENQSYDSQLNSCVGNNKSIKLDNYIDAEGKNAKDEVISFIKKKYHIIKPFVVDARIDISAPSKNKMAIPFVTSENYLNISAGVNVKRPLLEKIIIDRYILTNQFNSIGSLVSETIDEIKKIESIKDEEILNKISSGSLYGVTEKIIFIENINLIRAMITELKVSKKIIEFAQKDYYWLPIWSKAGPEIVSGQIHPIFPNIYYNDKKVDLSTENDKSILSLNIKKIFNSVQTEVIKTANTPDPSGYAFNEFFSLSFDTKKTESYGNIAEKQLADLLKKRNDRISKANQALKKIEIITGEVSGFGLCDIVAIMGGLYLMPKESLLGFLDADAYDRARLIIKSLPEENSKTIVDALKDLTENVKAMYDIMQKYYISEKDGS